MLFPFICLFSALALFRQRLVESGWFNRSVVNEAWLFVMVVGLVVIGALLSYSHPVIATILIAIGLHGYIGKSGLVLALVVV
jgi:hypothetical protein